ncbi:MAG TPA: ABC transporter permease [Micromonosporaceae bacterium]
MKLLLIARVNLRRTLRDKTAAFFLVVFPMLLILLMGVIFGGAAEPRIAIVPADGPLASRLLAELRAADGLAVRLATDAATATAAVERGELEAAVLIPGDYDARLARGGPVTVRYLARPGLQGQQIDAIVSAAVGREAGRLRAAQFVAAETGAPFDQALAGTEAAAGGVPALSVDVRRTGDALFPATLGRFDVGASSQLVLFVFLTAMTASAAMIETRQFGVARRMMASPTPAGVIVAGEALGRLAVAGTQALIIMLGSAVLFGVRWGDPAGAAALVIAFALVASGAGMLLGATARTTQQSLGVGLLAGLGLAALGGTMMPLEFFSPTMRTLAHLTPHAWAVDGFAELVRRGGGLTDVLPQVAVLLTIAAGLLALAAWRLRRVIAT